MSEPTRSQDRTPVELVAIVGSLRQASVNRVVMEAARELIPDGVTLTEIPLTDVPLFDGDIEDAGDPREVTALKEAARNADGLVIFTPEYNVSIPAVTKNAIDWLSRPFGNGPIGEVAVGVVAASPGGRGGLGVRTHLADSLSRIAPRYFDTTLGIGSVNDHIEDGQLTGDARDELAAWLAAFVTHTTTEPTTDDTE